MATREPYSDAGQTSPAASVSLSSRKRRRNDSGDGERSTGKRQMVSRACDACKQRKAKCSGTLPCANCTKKGVQCLYESKYARGRPPTPLPTPVDGCSGGSPAAPADRLQVQTPGRPGEQNEQRPRQSGQPEQQQPVSRASPVLGVTEIQGQYVEPTSGLAFLHRAWKRISRHRLRAVTDGSLSNGDERQQLQDRAGDKAYDSDGHRSSSAIGVIPIPDLATSKELVRYYHDVCVATYRFLHRPSVEAWLDQAHDNLAAGLPMEHGLGGMKAAILLAVLAVAIFHQGKSKGNVAWSHGKEAQEDSANETCSDVSTRKSDQLFLAASRLTEAATGYPALDSVQARLVQVLYLLHTSRLNQAWYVFGHALQIIAALGLHRRVQRGGTRPRGRPRDYIEAQCRKRTFWVAYILDTYMGVMFGRPRHYHDENIDQELPDAVNDEDMAVEGPRAIGGQDCAMDSLLFHARIGRIVGRISQSVYAINQDMGEPLMQVVQEIRSDIAAWTSDLPAILNSVHPASLIYPFRRQATTMRLARAHAMIHLNRPFLLRQVGSNRSSSSSHSQREHQPPSSLTSQAVSDCLAAAREVLGIVDDMAQDGTLFYAFWWTHYVAFCSLAVVYVWEIQRTLRNLAGDARAGDPASLPDLFQLAETCHGHLTKATARNSPSRRYSIILEELRQEALCHSKHMKAQSSTTSLGQMQPVSIETRAQQQPQQHIQQSYEDAVMSQSHGMPSNTAQGQWDGWQTIDWLDIDSLALGPISGLAASPDSWMGVLPMNFP